MIKKIVTPTQKIFDKTDWEKVINISQDKVDRESFLDKDNPDLTKKKFRKGKKNTITQEIFTKLKS